MHDNVYDNFHVCHLSSFPLLWLPLSQIAAAVRVNCPCRSVYCGQNFQTLNFRAVAYYHIQILYTIHCTVHNIIYIITNNYNNTPASMCTNPYRYTVCLKSLEIVVSLSPYMDKFWIVMFDA